MKRCFWLSIFIVFLIYLIALISPKPLFASTTTRFLYDGDGARVAKIEEGKTTLYVSGLEKNLQTGEIVKYYQLGGKNIALKEGNNLSFVISDHLTSLKALTSPTGQITANLSYYPYGQIRTQTGTIPSRQYTSQINDDSTGLYFYNARYYNPKTGNFTQADTAGDGLNKYIYVKGNPMNFIDPSGNEGENAVNSDTDCNSNPSSPSCIMLNPSNTYTPIQATQPLTMQPCYSEEECKANQEFFIASMSFLALTVGGGAVAEIATSALLEQATLIYIAGSNLWNQFAINHPNIATGIDVGSDLTVGISPSGLSMYQGLLRRGVTITHEGSWAKANITDEGQIIVNLPKNYSPEDIYHESVHVAQFQQALKSGLTPKQIIKNTYEGIPRALGELEASSKELKAAKYLGKDEVSILGTKMYIEVFEDVIREFGGTLPVNYNLIDNPYGYGLR